MPQEDLGDAPQFVVDQRDQVLERGVVAMARALQLEL